MRQTHLCPHCGAKFFKIDQHLSKCPAEPNSHARFVAFVATIAEDDFLPSAAVYTEKARATGADVPTVSALVRCYGTWSKTAAALGMRLQDDIPVHDKATVWAALREWFASADPPYLFEGWDTWAERNEQPSARKIIRFFNVSWADIVEEMAYSGRYPIRDEELEAAKYVGVGFRVARSYQAVYSRAGRMYQETRYVLR